MLIPAESESTHDSNEDHLLQELQCITSTKPMNQFEMSTSPQSPLSRETQREYQSDQPFPQDESIIEGHLLCSWSDQLAILLRENEAAEDESYEPAAPTTDVLEPRKPETPPRWTELLKHVSNGPQMTEESEIDDLHLEEDDLISIRYEEVKSLSIEIRFDC
ncbi:uncharacterized protein LY89DRAFT_726435 [Mollisia scopiformis]|uniref:Uncharacterized protein n=1 Tax=Mollisia scopiformis TaxID=149040 RepID=A0A132B2D5_MOLSC|nr:uncharacterized protein LY89DRAFT_726435 [Mollisia scopiformis]KUJ06550.1 hypothetical protein LY89DRAFT_726435 [Mollisia scopiformis]